jgi:hypothetical protein
MTTNSHMPILTLDQLAALGHIYHLVLFFTPLSAIISSVNDTSLHSTTSAQLSDGEKP